MVCVARDGVVSINHALHAIARKGTNLTRAQVQRAQPVIHGVGDQHIVPEFFTQFGGYQSKPLRFVKACSGSGSVGVAFFAVLSPTVGCQHSVEVFGNLQDAVPSGVGHQVGACAGAEQVFGSELCGEFDSFPRESECSLGFGSGHIGAVASVQGTFCFVFGNELTHE